MITLPGNLPAAAAAIAAIATAAAAAACTNHHFLQKCSQEFVKVIQILLTPEKGDFLTLSPLIGSIVKSSLLGLSPN